MVDNRSWIFHMTDHCDDSYFWLTMLSDGQHWPLLTRDSDQDPWLGLPWLGRMVRLLLVDAPRNLVTQPRSQTVHKLLQQAFSNRQRILTIQVRMWSSLPSRFLSPILLYDSHWQPKILDDLHRFPGSAGAGFCSKLWPSGKLKPSPWLKVNQLWHQLVDWDPRNQGYRRVVL